MVPLFVATTLFLPSLLRVPPSIPPSLDMKLFEVTVFQQIVPIVGDNLVESWFTLPGTKIFQFGFFPQLDLSLT